MLWLCIKLYHLPIEIFSPIVKTHNNLVIINNQKPQKVIVCNKSAKIAGIKSGMDIPTVYTLLPQASIKEQDLEKESRALKALATWATRFTSEIVILKPHSLLLEIGRSLRIFKGLDNLVQTIKRDLVEMDYSFTIATTPTPLSAQWFTEAGMSIQITQKKTLSFYIGKLPIEHITDEIKIINLLKRMGINHIKDLKELPRNGINHRFSRELMDKFDKAHGTKIDPQLHFKPSKKISLSTTLCYPTSKVDILIFSLRRPLIQMISYLRTYEAGISKFRITLMHKEKIKTEIIINLSLPTRKFKHLNDLITEKIFSTEIPNPVEEIAFEILEILELTNTSLFLGEKTKKPEIFTIIEKLRARLGPNAVYGLSFESDVRPEFAWKKIEPHRQSESLSKKIRPIWLLPQPRRLTNKEKQLEIIDGPERIESGWWDGRDIKRDYFIAHNHVGQMFWIYRERQIGKHWFLHGIFS